VDSIGGGVSNMEPMEESGEAEVYRMVVEPHVWVPIRDIVWWPTECMPFSTI